MTPREKVRLYALAQVSLVATGAKCSCHAMADIWGYATRFYTGTLNNDEETYVEDVSYILAGVSEWATGSDGTQVGRTVFTDSGFKTEFQDGSNQVQHFSAGVMAGFQYGYWGGLLHRIAALNDMSCGMGAGLDGIGTSMEEVQNKIEKYVCNKNCGVCNGGRGR
jgi:hypothetical protein